MISESQSMIREKKALLKLFEAMRENTATRSSNTDKK